MSGFQRARTKYILIFLAASLWSGGGSSVSAARAEATGLTLADAQESYSLVGQWQFRPGVSIGKVMNAYERYASGGLAFSATFPV